MSTPMLAVALPSRRCTTPTELHRRDRTGQTPLHSAAVDQNPYRVKALIAAGAEVDARESRCWNTPLMCAVQQGANLQVVAALVEAGADVNLTNANGETPLSMATVAYGASGAGGEILRYLLDHGADPYIRAKDGTTVVDLLISRAGVLCGDQLLQ